MNKIYLVLMMLLPIVGSMAQSVEWDKTFGADPYDAAVHTSDDIFVIGGFRGTKTFGAGHTLTAVQTQGTGSTDGFLLKLDRSGNTKWVKAIANDAGYGDALHIDIKGNNLYIASQESNAGFDYYTLVEKYDTSGNRIWNKTISNTDSYWVHDMFVDNAENVYLLYHQWQNTYVRKYDKNGNTLYTRTIYSAYSDEPESIVADDAGNFYITGNTAPASYNRGFLVAKFRPDGTNVFSTVYGGTNNQETYGYEIAIDDTANFYIIGWFNKTVNIGSSTLTSPDNYQRGFLAKFDSTGVNKWSTMINSSENVHTSAGTGYSAAAIKLSNDGRELQTVYMGTFRRYSLSGVLQSSTVLTAERYFGFDESPDASIYLAGETAYTTGYATKIGCGAPSINLPSTIDTLIGSTLNLSIPGSGYTVNWYSGATLLAGNTPTFSLTVNGDTTIRVEVANSGGCLASKTITINGLCYITQNNPQTICEGTSYQGYTLTGTYRDTVTGTAGCDTIKVLQLTVLDTIHTRVVASICAGQSLGGHSTTGTFTDVLQRSNGCDSVRTLVLTVLPVATSTITNTICFGDTYLGYATTGTYRDTFTAANGCDSIRTLNLTVRQQNITTINRTICQGDSYEGYTTGGTHVDAFTDQHGCDSTRTLVLTINNTIRTTVNTSVCFGDSYLGYNATGVYLDTFPSAAGCDSVRTLNLTIRPNNATTITRTICQGDSYAGYTTGGTYTDVFTDQHGCDSTRTLNLAVVSVLQTTVDTTLCFGGSFEGYTATGTYRDTVLSSAGCDSIRTLNLTIRPQNTNTITRTICQGDSFEGYTTTGTHVDAFTDQYGCDSTRTLVLTVTPTIQTTIDTAICAGETFDGYTIAGTYQDTLPSSTGCDSIRTLVLTVHALPVLELGSDTTICADSTLLLDAGADFVSYNWSSGDTTQTVLATNGSYAIAVVDTNGCYGRDVIDVSTTTCVGIDEVTLQNVTVYPNPFLDIVFVQNDGDGVVSYHLSDALGKTILKGDMLPGTNTLHLGTLSTGVYLLKVQSRDKERVFRLMH